MDPAAEVNFMNALAILFAMRVFHFIPVFLLDS